MKILVSGGAGFIGTHLCRLLRSHQYEVRVLDLVRPSHPVLGVEYLQGDVRKSEDIKFALDDVDVVFHFAAIVSVPLCQKDPVESYETNFRGTVRVIEAIQKTHKKPRLIFASSAAVYGNLGDSGEPLSEKLSLPKPLSFYASQKLDSEKALQRASQDGLQTLSFRFFNVYGSGQDPQSPYSGVISIFKNRLEADQNLLIHGDGDQTRDFIYVGDITRACLLSIGASKEIFNGQVMNLGSGKSMSIRELAHVAREVWKKDVEIEKGPAREADVKHSLANISKVTELLKWKPEMTFENGIHTLVSS